MPGQAAHFFRPVTIDAKHEAMTTYYSELNGPFRFFIAEHLATPFPFIARFNCSQTVSQT
jgi:hypothetical protein